MPGSASPSSTGRSSATTSPAEAGRLGYLQRLAVLPEHHGRGIGTTLIGDSLEWCVRKGCQSVLVNTQEANSRALALYEHLGFRSEPTGLAVLERHLDDGPAG